MAGDWLKIECNTPDKPEVFEIAADLGMAIPEAFGRLFFVWRLFDQQTEDGNATTVTQAYVDHVAGVTGFASAMRKVGWLAGGEDGQPGILLPDFATHNGKTAKSRVLTARRVATHKKLHGNAEVTQTPLPKEEKRREEVKSKAKPRALGISALLDLGVEEQAAKDWLLVRGAKKAPLTETALNDLKREADKAGISIAEAVKVCARKNWRGFDSTWKWQDGSDAADWRESVI